MVALGENASRWHDSSSYVESMKAAQELLKTRRAFITPTWAIVGGGITIVIVVAIGAIHHNPTPTPQPNSYPVAAQQSWMSSCETRNNKTASICSCELTYGSTLPRNRTLVLSSTFRSATATAFIFSWSGATPYRTRPTADASRVITSTS